MAIQTQNNTHEMSATAHIIDLDIWPLVVLQD